MLTVALMDGILHDKGYDDMLRQYYQQYPLAGYGDRFHQWAKYEKSRPLMAAGATGCGDAYECGGFLCTIL